MSYTAGIDNGKVGILRGGNLCKAELFEKLANLLAFVLVDFTAESIYGKSLHHMV